MECGEHFSINQIATHAALTFMIRLEMLLHPELLAPL